MVRIFYGRPPLIIEQSLLKQLNPKIKNLMRNNILDCINQEIEIVKTLKKLNDYESSSSNIEEFIQNFGILHEEFLDQTMQNIDTLEDLDNNMSLFIQEKNR